MIRSNQTLLRLPHSMINQRNRSVKPCLMAKDHARKRGVTTCQECSQESRQSRCGKQTCQVTSSDVAVMHHRPPDPSHLQHISIPTASGSNRSHSLHLHSVFSTQKKKEKCIIKGLPCSNSFHVHSVVEPHSYINREYYSDSRHYLPLLWGSPYESPFVCCRLKQPQ